MTTVHRTPEALYWSLFPCDVTDPDGTSWMETLVQIAATDGPPEGQRAGLVYVWTYNPATMNPQRLFLSPVRDVPLHLPSTYAPRAMIDFVLDTDAGPLKVSKSSGCGCRNPLKHVNPLAS